LKTPSGSAARDFGRGPRRRGLSIPAAGCKGRANAGHSQKNRRPKGFHPKRRWPSLLLGYKPAAGLRPFCVLPFSFFREKQDPSQFSNRLSERALGSLAPLLDTAANPSRQRLRRSDLFIANRPPKSKSPSLPPREDLSRLGSGERNLPTAKARYGPSKRARASHWAGDLSGLGSRERNLPTAKARYGPSERARVSHWRPFSRAPSPPSLTDYPAAFLEGLHFSDRLWPSLGAIKSAG
jgi:hypothetical protein